MKKLIITVIAFVLCVNHFIISAAAGTAQPQASDTLTIPIPVKYYQSIAREQLDYVNELRTGGNAWYWNSDNSTKTWKNNLSALTYDYELEKVAMQRAAELAVSYSHTRPDGSRCYTAYTEQGYSYSAAGENIASVGYLDAEYVVNLFAEESEDYSGQGHRRIILSENYAAVGFGCVYYNGRYYFVQEFSDRNHSPSWSDPLDEETVSYVRVSMSGTKSWGMSPDTLTVAAGSSGRISDTNKVMFGFAGTYANLPTAYDLRWTSEDQSILKANDDITYKALKRGTTVLHATAPDGETQMVLYVNVRSDYVADGNDPWIWSDDHMNASIKLVSLLTGDRKTVKASVTYNTIKWPTCTEDGTADFTATAKYDGETYKAMITAPLKATGHKWGEPVYTWSGSRDTMTVKAVRTCSTDQRHTEQQTAKATYKVISEASCDSPEKIEYTAVFTSPFTTQKKTVQSTVSGHTVSNVKYTWSKDHSECTAEGTCTKCGKKVTETVKSEVKVVREATPEKNGWAQYSAYFQTPGINPTYAGADLVYHDDSVQEMYRLYNPNSGEHFYTAKSKERDALVKVGWKYEGIGWYAPKTSNTPVYRLYNENAGDHHYTMKKAERDALIKAGWKDEKIGWYSDDSKGVPLYRQYNPYAVSGSHNYTTNKKENDALVKIGWKAEGIGWYGVKN